MTAWVNALLAFSLSMIVFATVASAITEAIQRAVRQRSKDLESMLSLLVEDLFAGTSGLLKLEAGSNPGKVLPALVSNLADPAPTSASGGLAAWRRRRNQLDSLDTGDLLARLADTDAGRAIWALGETKAKVVVAQIAARFERLGNDATTVFAKRARTLSVFISIFLAFALNIDALRLFSTFLSDPGVTAQMLARADKIVAQFESPATATAAPSAEATPSPPASPAVDSSTPAAFRTPSPSRSGGTDVEADLVRLRNDLDATLALGLPIGSQLFPWCDPDKRVGDCAKCTSFCDCVKQFPAKAFAWFVSMLLSGLLIGLGGPFWFDTFSKLSAFGQTLRTTSVEQPRTPPSAARPKDPLEPDPALWDAFASVHKALAVLAKPTPDTAAPSEPASK